MFERDNTKASKNKSKHGISFADTFAVFDDPNAVTKEDSRHDHQRIVTIGMDTFGRILIVVYVWQRIKIRIISARKAVRSEVR